MPLLFNPLSRPVVRADFYFLTLAKIYVFVLHMSNKKSLWNASNLMFSPPF